MSSLEHLHLLNHTKNSQKDHSHPKDDYSEIRSDISKFIQEKYFYGHCNNRSIEENWNLFKTTLNESVEKNIPTKVNK